MTDAALERDVDCQRGGSALAAKILGWPVEPSLLCIVDAPSIFSILADVAMLLLSAAFMGACPH